MESNYFTLKKDLHYWDDGDEIECKISKNSIIQLIGISLNFDKEHKFVRGYFQDEDPVVVSFRITFEVISCVRFKIDVNLEGTFEDWFEMIEDVKAIEVLYGRKGS